MNKKASATVILGILLIIVVMGWGIKRAARECSSDDRCAEGSYCGADFKCHAHPVITRNVNRNSLFWPSVIISLSIIGGAFILRRRPKKPVYQ